MFGKVILKKNKISIVISQISFFIGYNHPKIVTILLEKGADPMIKNKEGKTALNLGKCIYII